MRIIKIIIMAVVILAIGGILGVLYVWKQLALENASITIPDQNSASSTTVMPATATTSSAVFTKPITISTDNLPPAQKKILDTLGIGSKQMTITPGMVSCAVDALGSTRALEIKNGAAPTLTEGLTLMTCLKK
jgi:hypothetical protein